MQHAFLLSVLIMTPNLRYYVAVSLALAVLVGSVSASLSIPRGTTYPTLPINAGGGLVPGPYQFSVSPTAGTLVGSFSDSRGFLPVLVTTYTNFSYHNFNPIVYCSGTFRLSLPPGTYYIFFPQTSISVTKTVQVVYPALETPLPYPVWPNAYIANMTVC